MPHPTFPISHIIISVFEFRPPTHFSHMSHPTFPISHLLFPFIQDGDVNDMLDDTSAVAPQLTAIKRTLHANMQTDASAVAGDALSEGLVPTDARSPALTDALNAIDNPLLRIKQASSAPAP